MSAKLSISRKEIAISGFVFEVDDLAAIKRHVRAIAHHAGCSDRCEGREQRREIYFDTADRRFLRAGFCLRIGRGAGSFCAETRPLRFDLRAPRGASATVADDLESSLRAASGELGEQVRALGGAEPLGVVATRDVWLERRLLSRDDASPVVRFELEQVVPVSAETRSGAGGAYVRAISEQGPGADDLLRSLSQGAGVHAATMPVEAALFAAELARDWRPELGSTTVNPGISVAELAYVSLRRAWRKALAHEPGTRLGQDPEELHDLRVAVRRGRAALRLWHDYLPRRITALGSSLTWLGRALGEVRDLDVQLADLTQARVRFAPALQDGLDVIVRALGRQRQDGRRRLLRALDSQRFRRFANRISDLLQHGPGRVSGPAATIVAPTLMVDRFDKLAAAAARLAKHSSDADYHKVRIRAKSLRYALEFHLELYGRPLRRALRPLVALQDLLGEHQDHVVAGEQLLAWLETRTRKPTKTWLVLGMRLEHHRARAETLRNRFAKRYTKIGRRRWRELRALMLERAMSTLGGDAKLAPRPGRPS